MPSVATSWPSTWAVPLVAGVSPSRILISVDLPAPLAPTSPVTPSPTDTSSWSSAVTRGVPLRQPSGVDDPHGVDPSERPSIVHDVLAVRGPMSATDRRGLSGSAAVHTRAARKTYRFRLKNQSVSSARIDAAQASTASRVEAIAVDDEGGDQAEQGAAETLLGGQPTFRAAAPSGGRTRSRRRPVDRPSGSREVLGRPGAPPIAAPGPGASARGRVPARRSSPSRCRGSAPPAGLQHSVDLGQGTAVRPRRTRAPGW